MKKVEQLRKNAIKLGPKDFGVSWRKTKRFYVDWDGKIIHFGSKNFIDSENKKKTKMIGSRVILKLN